MTITSAILDYPISRLLGPENSSNFLDEFHDELFCTLLATASTLLENRGETRQGQILTSFSRRVALILE